MCLRHGQLFGAFLLVRKRGGECERIASDPISLHAINEDDREKIPECSRHS